MVEFTSQLLINACEAFAIDQGYNKCFCMNGIIVDDIMLLP